MYKEEFDEKWPPWWERLDNSVKIRVSKKIGQIIRGVPGRHLQKGLDYLVEEVGQYRVVYKSFEEKMVRRFYFVGTHDEYMKWLGLRK